MISPIRSLTETVTSVVTSRNPTNEAHRSKNERELPEVAETLIHLRERCRDRQGTDSGDLTLDPRAHTLDLRIVAHLDHEQRRIVRAGWSTHLL